MADSKGFYAMQSGARGGDKKIVFGIEAYGEVQFEYTLDEAEKKANEILALVVEMRKSPWDRAPVGSLIAVGHIANGNVARKYSSGEWRYIYNSKPVNEEDLIKGTWCFLTPKGE